MRVLALTTYFMCKCSVWACLVIVGLQVKLLEMSSENNEREQLQSELASAHAACAEVWGSPLATSALLASLTLCCMKAADAQARLRIKCEENNEQVMKLQMDLIEKMREYKAFQNALPPTSDEACFNLRGRLMEE